MKKTIFIVLPFLFIIFGLTGCLKDETPINACDPNEIQKEVDIIDAYLVDNNLTAVEDPSGLRWTIAQVGTGDIPTLESEVTVDYKLYGMDGKLKQEGDDVIFTLSRLIPAWQIFLTQVEAGTQARLYTPSCFAYGANGAGSDIAPYETLIFDITLKEVN